MTSKPTEEGWFWEWRTFGELPERALDAVEGLERRGADMRGDDIYLVSEATDQNVKLREPDLLKLKPLLARLEDGLELYEETARLIFEFPAPAEAVVRAAALLGVEVESPGPMAWDAFLAAFGAAPGVRIVRVSKVRTQYESGLGWVEVAELEFPRGPVRSLGVQSPRLSETRRLRDLLDPEHALGPMGYVEACRRWG